MADTTHRKVLITGAGSGFGKGAAIELARRGHDVIAGCETDQLDPSEVSMALADLLEAAETPVETYLPEGIKETLAAFL